MQRAASEKRGILIGFWVLYEYGTENQLKTTSKGTEKIRK